MDSFAGFRLAIVFTLAVLVPSALLSVISLLAIGHEREALRSRAVSRAQDEARELALALEKRIEAPLVEADRQLLEAAQRATSARALAEATQAIAGQGRPLRAAVFVGKDGAPMGAPSPDPEKEARRQIPLDEIFRPAEELELRAQDPLGALDKVEEIERSWAGDEAVMAEALAMRARLHGKIDGFPYNVYEACRRLVERYPLARDRDGSVLSLGARIEIASIWRRLGDDPNAARALEDLVRFLARHEEELRPREVKFWKDLALERLRAIDPALARGAADLAEATRRDREASRALRESLRGPAQARVKAAIDASPALREPLAAGGAPLGTLVKGEPPRGPIYCRPVLVELAPEPAARTGTAGPPPGALGARRELLGAALFELDMDLLRARDLAPLVREQAPHDELQFRLEPRGATPAAQPAPGALAAEPPEELWRERLRFPLDEWEVVAARRASGEKDELFLLTDRMRIWAFGLLLLGAVVGAALMTRAVWRERKSSELKSDFVTTVTHELKTPLTSIGMFAETLLMGRVSDQAEQRECLEIIAKETDRLTRLIDRVLTFSKIEAGRKRFDLRLTDMHDLCLETIALFETQMRGAEMRGPAAPPKIEVTVIHDLKDILCDRGSIQEVILNLLSNAYKYGGDERRIEVTLRKKRRWAMIEVRDWGIGIPRAEQKKIFRKFYRTDNRLTREREGSGIGLTLAQAIAHGHRGDITVRSKPMAGSTFTLWLPR